MLATINNGAFRWGAFCCGNCGAGTSDDLSLVFDIFDGRFIQFRVGDADHSLER